ncbi:MAG: GTP cyclohydrolase I, partial [Lachnospiraceae bacterium]|nr:GTP cyclohydrolase I [Lachnospiraceae bacterium]
HMCMTMRGVKKPGSRTTTIVKRGCFKEDLQLQNEVFRIL